MFACGIRNDSKTGAAMDEINSIAEMIHNVFINSKCMMLLNSGVFAPPFSKGDLVDDYFAE